MSNTDVAVPKADFLSENLLSRTVAILFIVGAFSFKTTSNLRQIRQTQFYLKARASIRGPDFIAFENVVALLQPLDLDCA